MTDITINTGPLPEPLPDNRNRYPFADMKVQDFFEIPADPGDKARIRHRIYCAAKDWAARNQPEWQFSVQRTATGVVCWRVK